MTSAGELSSWRSRLPRWLSRADQNSPRASDRANGNCDYRCVPGLERFVEIAAIISGLSRYSAASNGFALAIQFSSCAMVGSTCSLSLSATLITQLPLKPPPSIPKRLLNILREWALGGIRANTTTDCAAGRANHAWLGPVLTAKINRFANTPNHSYNSRHPAPAGGAYRDRHVRWARDAMDAAASGAQVDRRAGLGL